MSGRASPRRGEVIAVYAVWVGLILLSGITLLEVHTAVQEISLALQLNPWVARAVRQLALPVLGLIWLVFIFVTEHRLRTGLPRGTHWRRAVRAAASMLAIFVAAYALRLIL